MLNIMRKHATTWIIKVVLAVIVVVFVLWGSEAYRAKQGSQVAVVNGETISPEEYRSAYERLVEQYRRQFGNAMDSNMLETLDLKKQALDRLIERRLLLQKARALGVLVTDGEIIESVQNMNVFQQDGRFNTQLYQRLLGANKMTPEAFEEGLREDLLVEKTQTIIMAGAKVSDEEALESFKWREGQVSIDYVLFEPATVRDEVPATPEELESFFADSRSAFEIPPRINVGFVALSIQAFVTEVSVTEEEISQYFEINRAKFETPKKVRARHILFKTDAKASEKEKDEVRSKAEKVLQEIKGGADFADFAKKYSEDPGSKTKGGDLGFFAKERMVAPFSEAAFALKPGQISELVPTVFGWHIIKVEEVQEGKDAVLDHVKEDIRKTLVAEGAKNLAYEKAETLSSATYGGQQLRDAAAAAGFSMIETGFFAQGDPLENVNQPDRFVEVAFQLNDDEVSEPLELGDKYYVMQVLERQAASVPELSTVEGKVRTAVMEKKKDEIAKMNAEAFLAGVAGGKGFAEEAKALGLEVKNSGFFKRIASIPGLGFEQGISDAAFSLAPSHPLPENPIKGKKGYYVIILKEEKAADAKGFEDRKPELKLELLAQKQQKLLEDWLSQLRQKAEVLIEEGYLN